MSEATKPARTQKSKSAGNGSGSIFKRKSTGRWAATISWTEDDGRLVRKSRTGATMREAQAHLRDLQREREDATPKSTMALKAWLEIWLTDVRAHVRPTTATRYATAIRFHVSPLGERSLSGITTAHIEQHLDHLKASGLSPASAQIVRNVLSSAYRAARRAGLVAIDPVSDARPIKRTKAEVEILSPEHTEVLRLAAIEDHDIGAMVVMLLASGARIGEVSAMQVGDLDLASGRVRIERTWTTHGVGPTKSQRGRRTVSLPGWATDALRDHVARLEASSVALGSTSWLFAHPDTGQPWNSGTFRDHFRRLLRRNGLPMVKVHALRHQHVSHLIGAGANLLAISRRVGHSSLQVTTNVYAHVLDGADDELAALV